jgi:hypothetical protein
LAKLIKHKRGHSESTRLALAAFIIITEIVFLYFMASAGIEFLLSSMVLTLAVLLQLRFGMREDAGTPADIVTFIFCWLFLDLAPKIQLVSAPGSLVNTSNVMPTRVLFTNLICALFIVAFTVVYASLQKRSTKVDTAEAEQTNPGAAMSPRFTPIGICLAMVICVAVTAILGRTPYQATQAATITPGMLVVKKFLLFLPSATLLIYLNEMIRTRQKWVFSSVCVLIVFLLLLLITENPLTEKRSGLGPVYLSVLFVAFGSHLRSLNRRLLLLVASMALVFPAITVLTHSHRQFLNGVKLDAILDTLKDHYFSVNYDAWANTYTIVEMVSKQGLGWGRQLLGDLLFFVPSSLWHTKPVATGIAIGNYLILHHSGWFTNLSAPLVGEGYIDFGTSGVVLYGAGLAVVVVWLNRLANDSGKLVSFPIAIYAAVFLMFTLRGSLMVAVAYGTGSLLAFLAASGCLSVGRRAIGQRYYRQDPQPRFPEHESLPRLGASHLHHQSRG